MADKKLESFKAGSKQKPKVASRHKADKDLPESHTLGFARIEAILEKEEAGAVSASLHNLLESVHAFEDAAKSAKDKTAAKKAKAGVERTIDLLDFLFRTKAAMVGTQEQK